MEIRKNVEIILSLLIISTKVIKNNVDVDSKRKKKEMYEKSRRLNNWFQKNTQKEKKVIILAQKYKKICKIRKVKENRESKLTEERYRTK